MKRRFVWIFGMAVAAGMGAVVLRMRTTDEARLRREIRRLAERVEKNGPESALTAAARAKEIADFFVEEPGFDLAVIPYRPEQRRALYSAVFHGRSLADSVSIRLQDVSIRVDPDRATASMTIRATAAVCMGPDTDRVRRRFELDWRREPEGWRIAAVREVRALRPLPKK